MSAVVHLEARVTLVVTCKRCGTVLWELRRSPLSTVRLHSRALAAFLNASGQCKGSDHFADPELNVETHVRAVDRVQP